MTEDKIVLVDLPTFPKGIVSLSLLAVGSLFIDEFEVELLDLNLIKEKNRDELLIKKTMDSSLVGMKVSSQNFFFAKKYSNLLKNTYSGIKIVWGGEFPSLMADSCLEYADSIVKGSFEGISNRFAKDLKNNRLQRIYDGTWKGANFMSKINYEIIDKQQYLSFMGMPIETSRGCSLNCNFCMVHTMQPNNHVVKSKQYLKQEIGQLEKSFLNVIDYNFGIDVNQVIDVCEIIKGSKVLGWMAEMNIELLDNDNILKALKESRCRIIYCGLESIEEDSLLSVNKFKTKKIEQYKKRISNYKRIIKKAQSYNIQVAGGVILGLEQSSSSSIEKMCGFFQETGVLYGKLTFLTYNPGTKIKEFMKTKGVFSEKVHYFDGNHLSYVPYTIDQNEIMKGAKYFITNYYKMSSIIKRNLRTSNNVLSFLENTLFVLCYRRVYSSWLEYNILEQPENFDILLKTQHKESFFERFVSKCLHLVRQLRVIVY